MVRVDVVYTDEAVLDKHGVRARLWDREVGAVLQGINSALFGDKYGAHRGHCTCGVKKWFGKKA